MTSEGKIKANRENSRKSTGPNTFHGRRRAARNALRHGLSLSIYSDPSASAAVEALARQISGADADAEALACARRIAEAELDLLRICRVRHAILLRLLADPYYETQDARRQKIAIIHAILDGKIEEDVDLEQLVLSKLKPPEKLAAILMQETRALLTLARYERRALSRRKFAVRAFTTSHKARKLCSGPADTEQH